MDTAGFKSMVNSHPHLIAEAFRALATQQIPPIDRPAEEASETELKTVTANTGHDLHIAPAYLASFMTFFVYGARRQKKKSSVFEINVS